MLVDVVAPQLRSNTIASQGSLGAEIRSSILFSQGFKNEHASKTKIKNNNVSAFLDCFGPIMCLISPNGPGGTGVAFFVASGVTPRWPITPGYCDKNP
jgi:hypothetical protein